MSRSIQDHQPLGFDEREIRLANLSRSLPRLWIFAPRGVVDSSRLVLASLRAGGLGVFDCAEPLEVRDFGRSAKAAAGRFAFRFAARIPARGLNHPIVDELSQPNLAALIGFGPWDEIDPARIAFLRSRGHAIIAEVVSRDEALRAESLGMDALIAAGNEAGAESGDESSFILAQALLGDSRITLPIWVRGGIGPNVAAACVVAGARGAVIDGGVLLARECPIDEPLRDRLERLDGGETVSLRLSDGRSFRVFAPPGLPALARLKVAARGDRDVWDAAVRENVGWSFDRVWPIGQDAGLAAELARKYVTVGGIVQAYEHAIQSHPSRAARAKPLAEGSPSALALGTRYPIVQGPMTRVSDSVPFALAVAREGALPFLALALMKKDEVSALLLRTARELESFPWGVGILGFVPPELRQEQIDVIRAVKPQFVIIAGGRPDQAKDLERDGIISFLHVPSPGLLRRFLRDGARRFILEGRECGGHVGPRSSFVLWEQAIEAVTQAIDSGVGGDEIHLLFAGGIHDERSSAMVSVIAAPLVERGVKIGVLLGTAYLFTKEAVAAGAIVPGFQEEAIRCSKTVLLETGPGHEVRVSPSPFADSFEREREKLLREGRPNDEIRERLEALNAGRLRIAGKGLERQNGASSPLSPIPPEDQKARGLYMIGQVATLRDRATSIADLHEDIARQSLRRLSTFDRPIAKRRSSERPEPFDIAIIGMAAIAPGAKNVREFWNNTLAGRDMISEIPADRWDWRLYYDPDPKTPDKITSKWGGFLPEIPFDPLTHGMPPASIPSIEPTQLLLLETVRAALDDAGYSTRPFDRSRTAVVLGAGGGAAQLAMGYAFRSYLPMLDHVVAGLGSEALKACEGLLPEWTEDSFPGILLNVAAGRVANRFDLGGANYTVDAACGSSLAAALLAAREIETHSADLVILAAADTVQNPFTYLAFSKTHAFSPRGRCRPFDVSADGIVISEGVAAVALKRLADAERDGDRIYAVIKGIGASSDGRAKGLTAPRVEGQTAALERAYEKANVDPKTIGYVEAHGTGTAAGDAAETHALAAVFEAAGAAKSACALGSVKSSIGHSKCAAGLMGLINASLALYHQVLPPTIGVERLNPKAKLRDGPFYVSAKTRPWLHADRANPKRAAVSAFGFGGTNFHAVLEAPPTSSVPLLERSYELYAWRDRDRRSLRQKLAKLLEALENGAKPEPRDLAHTLALSCYGATGDVRATIVADSLDSIRSKLRDLMERLDRPETASRGDGSVGMVDRPASERGRIAFVFPGQGSQSIEMLAELALAFPDVRLGFEAIDAALIGAGRRPIGPIVFPAPAFDETTRAAQRAAIIEPEVSQPALAAACVGLCHLLSTLNIFPDALGGHSFGELVALGAAGVFSVESLALLAEGRGRFLRSASRGEPGAMAALAAGPDRTRELLAARPQVLAVNFNGPHQTVISGPRNEVLKAVEDARAAGLSTVLLNVAAAFHTPLISAAVPHLRELAASLAKQPPRLPVYSNVHAQTYSHDLSDIADRLGDHLARPVRFAEMIERMSGDGTRVFVEVGPGSTLTGFIGAILGDRPHLALACDRAGRSGLATFLETVSRLYLEGYPVRLDRLTSSRSARRLDLDRLERDQTTASTWYVNGSRARPADSPEPKRLGQGPPFATPVPSARVAPDWAHHHEEKPKNAEAGRIFEAYQQTMRAFLETQRLTMLSYLGAGRSAPRDDRFVDRRKERNGQSSKPNGQTRLDPSSPANVSETSVGKESLNEAKIEKNEAVFPILGREAVADRLLSIVRERTGYPSESLRLDLDLEADLGIDSIKRVEILSSLRDSINGSNRNHDSGWMDALSRARTLGAIVDQAASALQQVPALNKTSAATDELRAESAVRRYLIQTEPAPIGSKRGGLARGVVLITDDDRGIARDVAADLKSQGLNVVRVRHGVSQGEVEGVNLTSSAAVEALVDRLRSLGPLVGIVHVLPLRERGPALLDRQEWSSRSGPEIRGLFLLAKAAADDLDKAADNGGSCLIAATMTGGAFASDDPPDDFFPGHGGIAGLTKTLAREWPKPRTRVIDFPASASIEVIAAELVKEIWTNDRRAEIGYPRGERVGLRVAPQPLNLARKDPSSLVLHQSDSLIVTGGARGITASVALELAKRFRPTILAIGSGPPPMPADFWESIDDEAPAVVKSLIFDRLKRENRSARPADVEANYRAWKRDREIRSNLQAVRDAGAMIEYAQADVRDPEALEKVLKNWKETYGPPAGLIHAAGIIQDKLLRDKTPDSFDRVWGVKVDGALNLARLLPIESLKFAAFFSSIAGRFGNAGQSDYAAANEAVNKLAIWLDRRTSGRVVSMIWGPWAGIGMVSEIESHLARRGHGLIPPEIGARTFVDELIHGEKGIVEVVVSGELGPFADHDPTPKIQRMRTNSHAAGFV